MTQELYPAIISPCGIVHLVAYGSLHALCGSPVYQFQAVTNSVSCPECEKKGKWK